MEIYLIRHGQTDWNIVHRLQGSSDIMLNENGLELARVTGAAMKDVHFDKIYSSPLTRAYVTAELIAGAENAPRIEKHELLREMDFGAFEGKTDVELLEAGTSWKYFFNEPEKFTPAEGGESLEDLTARAKEFMTSVIEPLDGTCKRVLIVAHGAVNKALMMHVKNRTHIQDFWKDGLQKNCGVIIMDYTAGNYVIKEENVVFY